MTTKNLAGLCRRMAISLEAGIDLRTAWAREAQRRCGRTAQARLRAVSRAVSSGQSMSDALAAAGGFFPPLVLELVAVGEQSGHLAEIFAQLAAHYELQLKLRRNFLASIAWPLVQLVITVLVVGFLIWIAGVIGRITGTQTDVLGIGLVGNRGLAVYAALVAAVVLLAVLAMEGARRGLAWTQPIRRATLRLPVLGPALRTLALARLAWSLHLTLNSGMDVRKALRLSLQSTQNPRFLDDIPQIDAVIARNRSISEAFQQAGPYPADFLDSLQVGEQSGRLVESLALLSRRYQEQAQAALATLTMLAGVAVWVTVATLIVALIFRLFSFYLAAINGALKM